MQAGTSAGLTDTGVNRWPYYFQEHPIHRHRHGDSLQQNCGRKQVPATKGSPPPPASGPGCSIMRILSGQFCSGANRAQKHACAHTDRQFAFRPQCPVVHCPPRIAILRRGAWPHVLPPRALICPGKNPFFPKNPAAEKRRGGSAAGPPKQKWEDLFG